jgi:hypothetical protein
MGWPNLPFSALNPTYRFLGKFRASFAMGPKNSILPFLYPCELARSKFRHVLQRCKLSTLLPGTCWGVPAPNPVGNFKKICSLASGKGSEKPTVFLLPHRADCAVFRHQLSQGHGELQSPSRLSMRQKLDPSYWQPRRNLLSASLQHRLNNRTKKSSEQLPHKGWLLGFFFVRNL